MSNKQDAMRRHLERSRERQQQQDAQPQGRSAPILPLGPGHSWGEGYLIGHRPHRKPPS